MRELFLFADRIDATEECVRLDSHLSQFEHILTLQKEMQGRELDFLAQEMHRELTTMNAKTQDIDAIREILLMKGEVEKIRQQIHNIE